MHQHGVVHGLDQALEQLFAVVQARAALSRFSSNWLTAALSWPSARLALRARCGPRHPLARELRYLPRELADGALLAAFPGEEHTDTHG